MNIYKWFKIFNYDEFQALGLVSRTYTKELVDIGIKTFLVTQGNLVSITYEGVFLPIELNDKNPFEFEGFAVYRDPESSDVYFGFLQPEET
mgnify:CR=1 FL=1